MRLAFLALLAFAAPVPIAECSVDEEIVVQSIRSAQSSDRPLLLKERIPAHASAPAPHPVSREVPSRPIADWTPTVFTRPPPLR
jgi:hypothetical protein